MDTNSDFETGCCPRFDPAPWDEKEVTFQQRLFLKDRVRSLFRIPLNYGRVMTRSRERLEAAGASDPEYLILTDENSLWGADVYLAASKEVPGARMERLSGTFLTKVFEGPYRDAGKWMKEMAAYVASKGRQSSKTYFFYTTCPSCAKAYGKNYTVLLAQV